MSRASSSPEMISTFHPVVERTHSRNSRAFLEWVRSTTGWNVEIISGLEEARLIHLGIISHGRVVAGPVLLVDLGGGSCELTLSRRGQIRDTVSLPLGA